MIALAAKLARRELRGGVRGLRIVLACLALGVAAIAAVGSLRVGIERGLAANGSRILGGDIEIEGGAQALPDGLRSFLRARGATVSDVATMRSMLVAENGERQLVELKAVDAAWPLVGAAGFEPPVAGGRAETGLAAREGRPGLAVDRLVLGRLGLKIGDAVSLGREKFDVRSVLVDRAGPGG